MASTRVALQWLLVFFNILSMIIAILTFVFVASNLRKFSPGSPQYNEEIVQLIAGCVLLISAFIGCCGAARSSIPTLVALLLVLMLLPVTHIWKLFRYDEAAVMSATELLVVYKWIEELNYPRAMWSLQQQYECCGKFGVSDYTAAGMLVPPTCYRNLTPDSTSSPGKEDLFTVGCVEATQQVRLQVLRLEWVAHWTMIAYELFGMILSSLLMWRIVRKQRRYDYYYDY